MERLDQLWYMGLCSGQDKTEQILTVPEYRMFTCPAEYSGNGVNS